MNIKRFLRVFLTGLGCCLSICAYSAHTVEEIVQVLQSPIPEEYLVKARETDDRLLSKGEFRGEPVYLVTDKRLDKAYVVIEKLLSAMGQDQGKWIVRVLDTKKPVVNAFVTGGKYIYVFTGLLDQASSEDELAFVLAHEMGHSILKQFLREKQDDTQSMIKVVGVLAALSNRDRATNILQAVDGLTANYSQNDEAEADALAVAITTRAGYKPIKGIDFFTRTVRAEQVQKDKVDDIVKQSKLNYETAVERCERLAAERRASDKYDPNKNREVAKACREAQSRGKGVRY